MFKSVKTLTELEKSVAPTTSGNKTTTKKFLTIQAGESVKIRFRQELTEDAKYFDDVIGTAINIPVVTSPINWKWRAASTAQLDKFGFKCWATEQAAKDKAWRAKPHLVINVAVEVEPGTWEPRIIDTTFNQRHIGATLIEYAKEFGTITDRYYKFSRQGSGASDTNYNLIPLDVSDMPANIAEMPLFDLETVYMLLPYEKQERFFTTGEINKDTW
jgi:hypothetical protein